MTLQKVLPSAAFRGKALFCYLTRAKSRYQIHSPFVYDFIQNVLRSPVAQDEQNKAALFRNALYRDKRALTKTQQGAKSNHLLPERKTIRQEAIKSSVSRKHGQMLTRLVQHYRSSNILELGTSLGIGTMHLGLGQKKLSNPKLLSIEGCPATHSVAREYQKSFAEEIPELNHIELINGPFEQCLKEALGQFEHLDLLFIDGDHRYEAVLSAFQACQPKASPQAIFVIDDIHWSRGMENAWNEIQQMPGVTLTIDLFQMGLVFFDSRLSKQQLVLKN